MTLFPLPTISRTGETTDPLEVYFTVGGSATEGDGTTGSGDYDRLPGSVETSGYVHHVTIPAGQSGKTFSVTPVKDLPRVFEGEETISLTLVQIPQAPLVPLTYMLEPPPATGPSAHPTTAAVKLHDGEIVPGDSAQDNVDNGGEVPSTKAGQAGAFGHYVSPKAADKVVVLKAKALQAGQNFDDFYQWQVDGQNKAARADGSLELSRADAAVFDVVLLDKRAKVANKQLDHWKVWIVWVDMQALRLSAPKIDIGMSNPQAGFIGIATGVKTSWIFGGLIQPPAIITAEDKPNLKGPPDENDLVPNSAAPHFLDGAPFGQPTTKWDISRRVRVRVLAPNLGPNDISKTPNNTWQVLPSPNVVVATTPNPGAMSFPADPLEGNDDSAGPDEDNNPYDDPIGNLADKDIPVIMHVLDRAGVVGDTIEVRSHLQEFARLNIGHKWYVVSDPKKWRLHAKLKKVWSLAGRDAKPGFAGVDDNNNGTIDDDSEYGSGDDDDINGDGQPSALALGGTEGRWDDDGSVSDESNNGW